MKKIIIYLLIATTCILTQNLQVQDKELFISYNYSLIRDNIKSKKFEVVSSKNTSISILKTEIKEGTTAKRANGIVAPVVAKKYPNRSIYKNHKDNYLISQEIISGKDFYTKELLNQIQWELTGNAKTILKYNCQEATTTFRGREYIAYFTTELPFKAAPFKFDGLPGVVLQVHTIDDKINIEVASLKLRDTTNTLAEFSVSEKTMAWEDFVVFYKKRNKLENEKSKSDFVQRIKKFKKEGRTPPEFLVAFTKVNLADSRIEIIVPENDLSYSKKQMDKAMKEN
jgi:GLPGLI family protein